MQVHGVWSVGGASPVECGEEVCQVGDMDGVDVGWGDGDRNPRGVGGREEGIDDVRKEVLRFVRDGSPSSNCGSASGVPGSEDFGNRGCVVVVRVDHQEEAFGLVRGVSRYGSVG